MADSVSVLSLCWGLVEQVIHYCKCLSNVLHKRICNNEERTKVDFQVACPWNEKWETKLTNQTHAKPQCITLDGVRYPLL